MVGVKEGQNRKSARILALQASEINKKKNTKKNPSQQQPAEASEGNAGGGFRCYSGRRGRKSKRLDEVSVTPFVHAITQQDEEIDKHEKPPISGATVPCLSQMPEKRMLEFVLDILQRRDTYDIFAQPVDPEEELIICKVEGYYQIVKHPMDFGTMRAKLQEGMYTDLQDFEDDVLLIFKNAVHFNSSATIYFRQARAIHELAKRVFHTLKSNPTRIEYEFSLERRRPGRKPQGEAGSSGTKFAGNRACQSHHFINQEGDKDLSEQTVLARTIKINSQQNQTNSNGESRREFDSLSLRLIRPATVLTVLDDSLPGYNGNTSEIGALQIADPANQNNGTELFRTQEIRRQNISENNFGIQLIKPDGPKPKPRTGPGRGGQFVKDLGPTIQKVAVQKLARLIEIPNYQSPAPSYSVLDPDSLIASSFSLRDPTCRVDYTGSPEPSTVGNLRGGSYSNTNINDGLSSSSISDNGRSLLTTDSTYSYSGARGGAHKQKNVIIGENMDNHDGANGGKLTPNRTAFKGLRINSAGSIDVISGPGEKLASEGGRTTMLGASQEITVPPTDVMKIFCDLLGERTCSLGGKAQQDTVPKALGRRDSSASPRGVIQPSEKRDLLQGFMNDVRFQNQNTKNQLGLNYPVAGIRSFDSPAVGLGDKNVKRDMMVDSSQLCNQALSFPSNARLKSSLLELVSSDNDCPKPFVHPSNVVKPSRLGNTTDLLHLDQSEASLDHNRGASLTEVSQLMERSILTPWGPQATHDFPEIHPQLDKVDPVGKDALMQQDWQSVVSKMEPLDSGVSPLGQDLLKWQKQQPTQVSNTMQPPPCEITQWGQDKFGEDELQLALASYMQTSTEPELQFSSTPYMPPLAINTNPIGLEARVHQETQHALATFVHPQPYDVNRRGKAPLIQQEPLLAGLLYVQMQPSKEDPFRNEFLQQDSRSPCGLPFSQGSAYEGPFPQRQQAGTSTTPSLWNFQKRSLMGGENPGLAFQLGNKPPPTF
ncbi:hypothetical protein RJ639_028263 [Escallonia herrerae]|uniref:Bromo domain-containing protein n=1 Tax=Escallonia herrerae TaxID=1293975 RepID=A0AA89BF40_9ASTE|nr:hypothetical protein RJ639_028263 [Escallonia herrerae]